MKWNILGNPKMDAPLSWQQLPQGERYCSLIGQYLTKHFAQISGDYCLKLGALSGEVAYYPCDHQIIVSEKIPQNLTALSQCPHIDLVQAQATALPFVDECFSACLLAHGLHFTADPHQVLRETTRTLNQDGILFLSLFNPLSLFSLKQYLPFGTNKLPFHPYFASRIVDWLSLLNFDLLDQQCLSLQGKPHYFGEMMIIVAQKRTLPMTLNPQTSSFSPVLNPATAFRQAAKAERLIKNNSLK
ncbi:class I SAM-dependent methyltransferase [Avibacterium paragallinarum]|uniref:class I SAM-dependent methyltransferase n=1 Tax=Avibacterium paragallinarum TaxID=728 RepID=UPI0039861B39